MEKQKKGLSAFLKKQKQKTAGTKGDAPADASPEKEKVDVSATTQAEVEAEQARAQQEQAASKTKTAAAAKHDDSDDDSEDDDLGKNVQYGKVQEKEEMSAAEAEKKSQVAHDLADLDLDSKAKDAAAPKEKVKKTAGNITFGSGVRPSFGNRVKQGAIMKDDGGLDDLDDDVKGKKAKKNEIVRSEMQSKRAVVEREEPVIKAPTRPVRPTFKGKLNLTGAGADTSDSGVKAQYSFSNTYKTENNEEEEKTHAKPKQKGVSFNITGGAKAGGFAAVEEKVAAETTLVDEDGFEVVGAVLDRKTRRAMNQASREPEDEDFKILRNEKRGNAFDAMNN